MTASNLHRLVAATLAPAEAEAAFAVLRIAPALLDEQGPRVSRALCAMALNVALFADLLRRVPTGAAYVADVRAAGGEVVFDHGALRTIRFAEGPTGALPAGQDAFVRMFEPLGYRMAGLYPLDRLGMTGRAYAHIDHPEAIPQFFLSELHVERFSSDFQAAAHRAFDSTADSLGAKAQALLDLLRTHGDAPYDVVAESLPALVSAFGRHHHEPALADYRLLLAESAEAAWIATEGAAFNHATDRVPDVEALAAEQRRLGRPIKDTVEVSGSGRVRQTAFKADRVVRAFRQDGGGRTELSVPGSFYEFISRQPLESAGLDLAFDSSNAQGIFKMTAAGT